MHALPGTRRVVNRHKAPTDLPVIVRHRQVNGFKRTSPGTGVLRASPGTGAVRASPGTGVVSLGVRGIDEVSSLDNAAGMECHKYSHNQTVKQSYSHTIIQPYNHNHTVKQLHSHIYSHTTRKNIQNEKRTI